jgi:transcriptional regulator with XRE-family HTH domain
VDDVDALLFARMASVTGLGRDVRIALGFSLNEIAQAAEISKVTVGRYEQQLRKPRGGAGIRYGNVIKHLSEDAG